MDIKVGERTFTAALKPRTIRSPIPPDESGPRELFDELPGGFFQQILASITDGFYVLDRRWRYVFVNPQAERYFSTPAAELIGKCIWEKFPPKRGSEFEARFARVVEHGKPTHFEAESPLTHRWLDVHVYPYKGGVSVLFRDIHERKELEERLKRSEKLYRGIGESIDYGIWVTDADGRNIYTSESLLNLLGITQEQVADYGWADALHPDEAKATAEAWRKTVKNGTFWTREHRYKGKDGNYYYVLARGVPIRDEGGRIVAWAGINLDISELKAAQAEIRENEKRFSVLADSAPVMLWVLDSRGKLEFVNRGYLEYFGTTEEGMQSHGWEPLVHPEDLLMAHERLSEGIQECRPFSMEIRVKRADGSWRWVKSQGEPRFDSSGTYVGHSGVLTDITDLKAGQAEREKLLASERVARAESERANRSKDEFVAVLSHELRTPLNAVLGWAHILKRGKLTPEKMREGLDSIERNTRIQAQLISDLLDINRIVAGKIAVDLKPIYPAVIVRHAVESVAHTAARKGVAIEISLEDELEPVMGDSARLHQIVTNLLSNALKFTPAGGTVVVSQRRRGKRIEISVADNGEGIEPELLGKIFERYMQADSSSLRRHGGLGLGLSIVKKLMDLHNGEVVARSEGKGHGATFTLYFPVALSRPKGWAERRSEDDEERSQIPEQLTVLLVDDDVDALGVIRQVFENSNSSVTTATSARDALSILCSGYLPDILISDIGMPGQDGYRLIREVRDLPECRELPAIALTAFAAQADRTRAIESGYDAHISKPVEPAELIRRVAGLLAIKQQKRAS